MELLDSIATDFTAGFTALAAAVRVEPIVLAALLQLMAFALAMLASKARTFWGADPEGDEPDDLTPAAVLPVHAPISVDDEELVLLPLSAISTCAQVRQWIELHPAVEIKTLPSASSQLVLW